MSENEKNNVEFKGTVRKPLVSVDDLSIINEPKPELLEETLKKLKISGNVLIILDENSAKNTNLIAAAEGLQNVSIVLIEDLRSKDVLPADYLLVTKAALKEVAERLSKL